MSINLEVKRAADLILQGGHILCPTDTVWGLSADATNFSAVKKVFELKQRPKTKSMIVLVSSLEMLATYVEEIPDIALDFLQNSTHPTSLVYPKAKNLAPNVPAENGSIAIRIVKNGFCFDLINHLGRPIISTSANLSGEPSPTSFLEISDTIKRHVDFCVPINQETSRQQQASAIYIIEGNNLKKIR